MRASTILDTTSFSLTGAYVPDSDEHAMASTYGYAKDHRPALQQAVLEFYGITGRWRTVDEHKWGGQCLGHPDGPGTRPSPPGDHAGFAPPSLCGGRHHKRYTEENATNLAKLGFITRIPGTLTLVSQVITPALKGNTGQCRDATTRYQRLSLCHYGTAQRWLVVGVTGIPGAG